jgi:hypothetical protein
MSLFFIAAAGTVNLIFKVKIMKTPRPSKIAGRRAKNFSGIHLKHRLFTTEIAVKKSSFRTDPEAL